MGTLYRSGSPSHAAVVAASLLVILAALLPSVATAQGLSPATYIRLTFITRPTTASVKAVVLQQVPSATASDTDTFDLPNVGEMAVMFNGTKAQTQYTELVAYLSGNPTALAQMTLSKFLRETAAVVTPAPPGIVTPSPGGVTPIPTVSLPPQSGGSDEFPAWGIVLITIGIIIVMAVGGFIGVQWYMSRSLEETEEKIEKLERRRSSETRRESRVTFQPHGAFGSEEGGPAGNDGIELRPVAHVDGDDVEVVDGGATTSHHPSDKYHRGSAIAHDPTHGQEKTPADLPPEVVTREIFLQKNSSDGTGEQPQHQAFDTNGSGNGEHHVIHAESGEAAGTGNDAALGSQLVRTTISGQQLSPPGAAAVEHGAGSHYDYHLAHHDDADHDGAAPPAQGSYSPREDGGDAGVVFAAAQQEEGGGGGIEVDDDDDDEGVVEVAEDTPGGDYPIDIR